MQLWALKREVFYGCKYTPLYEKGIKETQNKPMETTNNLINFKKKVLGCPSANFFVQGFF